MTTMKQLLARAVFTGASLIGAASAHAGGDVFWSIGIEAPLDPYGASVGATISNARPRPIYRPAPVYVQPAPILYAPAPVYYHRPAPVIVRPAPVYRVHPAPVWSPPRHQWYGHGHQWRGNDHDWKHDRRDRRDWRDRDDRDDRHDRRRHGRD